MSANRARDEATAELLAANDALADAVRSGDAEALGGLLSADLVVSDPGNRIRRRDELIALFASGQVVYASVETSVDFVERLGDLGVVIGWEVTTPTALPADVGLGRNVASGDALRRRFTNVFRREDGTWKLVVKQSTVVAIE